MGYNSSQLNARKPCFRKGIALEKPASLFLSLALNNPRAWLSCAMGLRIPLKATLNGQKMLLPDLTVAHATSTFGYK